MTSEDQRMASLFLICGALTVVTTVVSGVTIAHRRATEVTRTQDSQSERMTTIIQATEVMVNNTLTRMRVATFANRNWILSYAASHPNGASLLVNRSTFVDDWNSTLFELWAPQINSSPDQLYTYGFHGHYTLPSSVVLSPSIQDYADTTWNGTSYQVHAACEQLTDEVFAHRVTQINGVPYISPTVSYTRVDTPAWYGQDEYFEEVITWATVDGTSSFFLSHQSEFAINGVAVQVQSGSRTHWTQSLPSRRLSAECMIVDNYQQVIASDSDEYDAFLENCQLAHAVPGTSDSIDACLSVPASVHPVKVIRDMFLAANPDNSSADIADSEFYTTVSGRRVLLAVKTLVAKNSLKLDVVCIEDDTSNANTGATDMVLSLFPAIGSALILLALVAMHLWSVRGRGTWNAPKDMTKPMAMMFTDVQSSTALWARDAEAMSEAIEIHHATIRAMVRKHGGYEVKTIGDAFMVAFKDPRDAVRCALAIQTALLAHEWPEAIDEAYEELLQHRQNPALWHGLRVRIGLHYGNANISYDQTSKSYDYYGTLVNTAARVESVGHGGQILMTGAVVEVVGTVADTVAMTVGRETLRGLSEPVDLVQLLPTGLHTRSFPALRLDKAADLHEEEAALSDKSSSHHQSADGRSSHASSYAESIDVEGVVRAAAAKLAVSLPHIAVEDIENGIASQCAALESFFAVGNKEFKKSQLCVFCEKWGVPVPPSGFNFELSLIRVAAKVYAASVARKPVSGFRRISVPRSQMGRNSSKSIAPSGTAVDPSMALPGAIVITDASGVPQ